MKNAEYSCNLFKAVKNPFERRNQRKKAIMSTMTDVNNLRLELNRMKLTIRDLQSFGTVTRAEYNYATHRFH